MLKIFKEISAKTRLRKPLFLLDFLLQWELLVREEDPEFKAMRKQHPAVESAINHLEHHGLDRVYAHGADGFDKSVSLSILGANIHRLGQVLRAHTIKAQKRKHLAA